MGFRMMPSTSQQNKARDNIYEWMNADINYPTLQIAGLTDLERANQGRLSGYLADDADTRDLATAEIQSTLGGGYDPMDSTYWKGYRDYAAMNKEADVAAMRRFSQRGGMTDSTPAQFAEAGVRRAANNESEMRLGGLMENERGRRLGTAQTAEAQTTNNLYNSERMAAQERAVQQAQQQAVYEKILNDLLAPYMLQSPLAQQIINEQRFYYKQKSSGTNWGQIAGAAMGLFTGGASTAASGMMGAGSGMISTIASNPGMMSLNNAASMGQSWMSAGI